MLGNFFWKSTDHKKCV